MKRVSVEFQDDAQARLFADEMRERFNYPEETSRYRVVHGKDENGNAVFVNSSKDDNMTSKDYYPEGYDPNNLDFSLGMDEDTDKMGFCFEFLMNGDFFTDNGIATYSKANEFYSPATYWDPEDYSYDREFSDIEEEVIYNETQDRKATQEEINQLNANKELCKKMNHLLNSEEYYYSLDEYIKDFGA